MKPSPAISRSSRKIRFLLGGAFCALVNLALIHFFIDVLGWNSPLGRQLANVVSIELSLLMSFVIYRVFVWPGGSWQFHDVLWRQLPLYHLSAGVAVLLRALVIFPVLDALGVHYGVNTFVGILVSAALNYLISDRIVFSDRPSSVSLPEGLEPAFASTIEAEGGNVDRSRSTSDILSISVVMPAYNEEGSLRETVVGIYERLSAEGIEHEILVINDNSKDGTEQVLIQLQTEVPTLRYMTSYYPGGFGFAVRCGLENFSKQSVAIMMADASDAPEDLVTYFRTLQAGYDCAFGSRFVKGGQVIDYPRLKLMLNRLANLFVQTMVGIPFNDTTNAFKAYRAEVIRGISPLVSHHFNLTVEMPLKAYVRGYTFAQVPITWRNRKTGVSKLKIREMGSRYLFIVLSVLLEKHLSRGDYVAKKTPPVTQTAGDRLPSSTN